MSLSTRVPLAAALLAATALAHAPASAQFGVNLPRDDFTWVWGDRSRARGPEDFSTSGSEAGFRCNLVGQLRPGSQLSTIDVRQIETDLRSSLFFIQSAANMMNALDVQRDLEWAELACESPDGGEEDEAKRAERLERARQKAMREQAERRERQQREEQQEDDR